MDYKIIWSARVLDEFNSIVIFLRDNWGSKSASDFAVKFLNKIGRLERLPLSGSKSSKQIGLRKILITKHNYLLYEIIGNRVELFSIIDTRQNPDQ